MGRAAEYISPETAARLARELPYRHRLIVEVAAVTGLRISDVLQLQPEDVAEARVHRGWLRVLECKTGKQRAVHLPARLLRQLEAFTGQYWVFESPLDPRRHLTRQAVNKMLAARAKGLRLGQQVSPHGYRKQYAVQLMHRSGDLGKVQRALGHRDPGTTALYALSDKLQRPRKRRKAAKTRDSP